MDIEAPFVARKAEPGQFIILRVDEEGERIPLTVAGTNADESTVKIIFQVVGATTKKLSFKEEGEYIQDFVGPLGKPTHTEGINKVCVVGMSKGIVKVPCRAKNEFGFIACYVGFPQECALGVEYLPVECQVIYQ